MNRSRTLARLLGALGLLLTPGLARAGAEEAITFRVEHEGPIILGEAAQELTVSVGVPAELDDPREAPKLTANVGSFGPVERVGEGQYRGVFHLPRKHFPQVVLVAIWWQTRPEVKVPIHRIRLFAKTSITVRARRGARVTAIVGEQRFGPEVTRGSGVATIPIVVPPGLASVMVEIKKGRSRRRQRIDVGVPPYSRLILLAVPDRVVPGGNSEVRVMAYLDEERPGRRSAPVQVKAPSGRIERLGQEGGWYLFRFVPRRDEKRARLRLRAWVKGDAVNADTATVRFGPGEPSIITFGELPGGLVADGASEVELAISVKDRYGNGVDGLRLEVRPGGARLLSVEEGEPGVYRVRLGGPEVWPEGGRSRVAVRVLLSGREPLEASLEVPVAPPPWPSSISIQTDPAKPFADGRSSFEVVVDARDASGAPFTGGGLWLVDGEGQKIELETAGEGGYRTRLVAAPGRTSMTLRAASEHGEHGAPRTLALRAPPKRARLGARLALGYDGALYPSGGLEASWWLRGSGYALALVGAAEYRFNRLAVSGLELVAPGSALEARVRWQMVTGTAGLRMMIRRLPAGMKLHATGSAALVGWEARSGVPSYAPTIVRGLAPAAELSIGLERSGLLLQAMGRGLWIRDPELSGPGWSVSLALGYEWGVL
ncbi:MAG: hypothetical protein P1V51_11090 [Deltaproteobacteria bacterium]|nr:hypothetical protein [Deltaproteobacteria bacterium]